MASEKTHSRCIETDEISGCERWGVGAGELVDGGPKTHACSYRLSRFRDVVYNGMTTANDTSVYLKVA